MRIQPQQEISLPPCIAMQFYHEGIITLECKKKCCEKFKKKGKKPCKSCPR